MKDSYSFDRDPAGLDESYAKHVVAYDRIFDRTGLEWYRVESDVGMMGGSGAHEYMAPCPAGENDVALAPGYAANVEVASAEPQPVQLPPRCAAPAEVADAGRDDDRGGRRAPRRRSGRAAEGVPRRRPTAGASSWSSCAATTASTTSSSRNHLGEPFRPAQGEEIEQRLGPAGLHRPRRRRRPGPARRGGRRRRSADGWVAGAQPAGSPPAGRRAGARLRLRALRRAHGRGRRPRERRADPDRAGDRGRQHLQARHALQRAARRDLPRRVGQGAADRDGLLRHRAGAHRRRDDRADRRRAGHRLAALARAVAGAPGGARQGRNARARSGRGAVRGTAGRRPGGRLRRPGRRRGGEVRRRRAARLPGAPDGRAPHARGRARRGAGPPRPGRHSRPCRCAKARRRRSRRCCARLP